AVRLDDTVTVGARATYDDGTLRADGLLAYSNGLQATLDAGTKFGSTTLAARVRYQAPTYTGLAPLTPGLTVGVDATTKLTPALSASAQAEYHDSGAVSAARVQGGSVTARADYQVAPFSVGAGIKAAYGDQQGVAAVVGVGYHRAPVDVDVTHSQPLGGGTLDPTTTVSAR
ncbi:DUF11 domain-containing protein, partial [Deinococcus rufus]